MPATPIKDLLRYVGHPLTSRILPAMLVLILAIRCSMSEASSVYTNAALNDQMPQICCIVIPVSTSLDTKEASSVAILQEQQPLWCARVACDLSQESKPQPQSLDNPVSDLTVETAQATPPELQPQQLEQAVSQLCSRASQTHSLS